MKQKQKKMLSSRHKNENREKNFPVFSFFFENLFPKFFQTLRKVLCNICVGFKKEKILRGTFWVHCYLVSMFKITVFLFGFSFCRFSILPPTYSRFFNTVCCCFHSQINSLLPGWKRKS